MCKLTFNCTTVFFLLSEAKISTVALDLIPHLHGVHDKIITKCLALAHSSPLNSRLIIQLPSALQCFISKTKWQNRTLGFSFPIHHSPRSHSYVSLSLTSNTSAGPISPEITQSLPSPAYILQPSLNTTVFLLPLLPPNIGLNPWQLNTLQQLPHCAKSRFQSLQWLQGPAWSGSCPLLHPDFASATFLLAVPKHPKLLSTSTLALIVPSIWALSAGTLFFKFQLKSHLRGHLRIFSLKQYTHLLKA